MVLVTLFTTLVSAVRQYLLQHTSIKIDVTLIIIFYRHLLKLPIDYFEKRKIGDFVSRFAEAEKVRELLTGTAITTLLDSVMVIVYLALMFYYNAKLALVLVIYVPCFALLTFGFTPYLNRKSRDMFARHADSESMLVESISGIHTIKTLGVERGMRWRWEELKLKAVNVGLQMMMASVAIESMISVLYRASSMVVLYLGAWQVMEGALTVGELMAFNTLMFSVITPIGRLMGLWQQGQEARLAVERLNDVLDSEIEQSRARSSLLQLPTLGGHVKLENVSYRFGTRTDANVLTGIDLELFPGQTVAIVGRSGSGKTTLAKLLMGMYKPTEGRILVDGIDLQSIELASYRRQLGVVAQDSFLFSGTMRENIALGDPEPDFNAVVQAATLANAHDFICGMPLGYDTVVGERGANLSGGQRQRISIARALYRNPRLLILDEATSALDVESEAAIQKHLKKVLADRTAVVIAHRLSTVMDADLIVVLDRGVIVETGNHKTLLEKQGLYYYLTSQQLKL
jgi:ATP-binding cassette subfamily B protein